MNAVNMTKHTLISALAGLALLGTGMAVAAQPQADSLPSITVKYDAIELATTSGAVALYRRIRSAAAKVCERYESQELVRRTPWQKCYSQVVANAVAAVHQPTLTALHEFRGAIEPRG